MRISKQGLVLLALLLPFGMGAQKATSTPGKTFSCSGFTKMERHADLTDAPISDRFGNPYTFEELTPSSVPTSCSEQSVFELDFSGEFSADEEATICQVFTDLSGLLESQREGILIRIVKTPLNEGVYGAGTSFYLEDANGQGCGIGNNMVWEQMNTAVDYDGVLPYHTASGVLKINQTLPSPNYWHTLHDDLPDGQLSEHAVDLYTVVLHEALHILGFASRIQPDGLPVNGFYSRWDKLLYTHDENANDGVDYNSFLLQNDPNSDCCNAMTINTTAFSGVAAGMACHTGDLPLSLLTGDANGATVYGPLPNESNLSGQAIRNRLSHLYNDCDDANYVMHYNLATGEKRRDISDKELDILCQLGYTVQGDDTSCNSCEVIAIDDLFFSEDLFTTIATSAILENDELPEGFNISSDFQIDPTCGDAATLQILPFGNGWLIKGLFPGQRYAVCYTISGCAGSCDQGTFYIERPPEYPILDACAQDICAGDPLFCYGDFEAFETGLHYSYHSQLQLENCHLFNPGSINSPDILEEASGNQYAQIVNAGTNIELLTIPLQSPIPPGCQLELSFDYKRYFSGQKPVLYCFGTTTSPCETAGQPDPANSLQDGFVPIFNSPIAVGNYNWQSSGVLTWVNSTDQPISYISFVNMPGSTMTSKVHLDNVEVSMDCANRLNLSIASVAGCWNEQVNVSYSLCLTGSGETPVDVALDIEGPALPGWSLDTPDLADGPMILYGLLPDGPCQTIDLSINVSAALPPDMSFPVVLRATAPGTCLPSAVLQTAAILEDCCPEVNSQFVVEAAACDEVFVSGIANNRRQLSHLGLR